METEPRPVSPKAHTIGDSFSKKQELRTGSPWVTNNDKHGGKKEKHVIMMVSFKYVFSNG